MGTNLNQWSCGLMLICVLSLAACGGGGGGGGGGNVGSTSGDNMTALKIELLSDAPTAGHQVSLKTTIRSNRDYENLSVLFALVSKADVESESEDVTVLLLDEHVISQVTEGESDYNYIGTIPVEAKDEAEWYLTPVLDALEEFEETDKSDNVLSEDRILLLTIANDNTNRPDVAIKSIEYEDSIVLKSNSDDDSLAYAPEPFVDPLSGSTDPIDITDIVDYDFSASLELAVTGAESLPVGVYGDLIMVIDMIDKDSREVTRTLGQSEYPLLTWDWGYIDPDTGDEIPPSYSYYLEQEVFPDEQNFVNLEFLIPGKNHDDVETVFGFDFNESGLDPGSPAIGPFNIRKSIEINLRGFQGENERLRLAGSQVRVRVTFFVRIQIDKANNLAGTDSLDEYEGGYIDDGAIIGELAENDIVGNLGDINANDSEIWLPLAIFVDKIDPAVDSTGIPIPLPPGECRAVDAEKVFDKNLAGGSFFGLALKFNNKTTVKQGEGAFTSLSASVPLTLFGQNVDLFSFNSEASLKPENGTPASDSFSQSMRVTGQNILPPTTTLAGSISTPLAEGMVTKEVGGKWSPLGGITLTAAATMGYGLELNGSIGGKALDLGVGPFANLQGSIRVSVNAAIFNGSIEGTVELLKDTIQAKSKASFGNISLDNQIPGTLTASLVNKLSGPQGKIEAVGTLNSCLGLDSAVNSVVSAGKCFITFGLSCGSVTVLTCPQLSLFREPLVKFDLGLEKTDTLLQKNVEFGFCP